MSIEQKGPPPAPSGRPENDPAALLEEAKRLALAAGKATLASRLARGDQAGLAPGHPHASLVLLAWEPPFRPLLLLSSLADHTKNLAADPAASLLIDGTEGLQEPLAGARVTLFGTVNRHGDQGLRSLFVERHPSARRYADFTDFVLYAMRVERLHFVAGFGRIAWLPAPP